MTLLKPIWAQASGGDTALQYSANELREFLRGLIVSEGVLDTVGGALKVTQRGAGANFSIDVAAGHGAVLGDDIADQGMYLVRSTAAANFVTPSPPGSGTRIHRVVAQIRDKTHSGSWTTYDWTPVVLPDVGAGTPALPASALPLARVSIAAGQASVLNANITDDRINARLLNGGPALVASAAARPLNPYTGETIFRTDLLDLETWNGVAWWPHGINRPSALLKRTADQTITDSTVTAVGWTAEEPGSDSHGGHSTVTNNSRYTAPISGVYQVSCSIPWAPDPDGVRELNFRVTSAGVPTTYAGSRFVAGGNFTTVNSSTRSVPMLAGDYVEAMVWHTAGAGLAIDFSYATGPRMEVTWMRPL